MLVQQSPAQWEGNIFRQTHVADQLGSQEVLDEQHCLPSEAAQPFHHPQSSPKPAVSQPHRWPELFFQLRAIFLDAV